jgi:Tol biopolymer transport system component
VAPSALAPSAVPSATAVVTATPTQITVRPGEPWIVFQWQRGQVDGIFLMRPDGTDTHPLLGDAKPETVHPDWSPDGARIAYEAAGAKAADIWVAGADGSSAAVLVDRNAECGTICGDVAYPAWSPDGRQLAFARFDFEAEVLAGAAIEIVDVATGQRHEVYRAPEATVLEYPRWSPNGRSIVFASTTFPTTALEGGKALGSTIAVVDVSSPAAKAHVLTKPTMFSAYPDWHPTEDLIVFSTYDLGEFQGTDQPSNLYTIKPDGSALTPLTSFGRAGQRATQPTWAPDGARILFTLVGQHDGFDNPRQAAFVDADGKNLVTLQGSATHPRLRPMP